MDAAKDATIALRLLKSTVKFSREPMLPNKADWLYVLPILESE